MKQRHHTGSSLHRRVRQRGYSLVELAIVLGVVGLVSGGIWVLASRLQEMGRVRLTQQQMIVLHKNIRGYYQTRACVQAGDQTAILRTATVQVFPREMISGAAVVDQWGGGVSVFGGLGPVACYSFTVQFDALSPAVCAELVPQLTAPGEISRGLQSASINGVVLTNLPPNPTDIVGTAAGQCNQNATATVALTYQLRSAE